jgi:uncharacterized cupredoxin-like copper-binding protein
MKNQILFAYCTIGRRYTLSLAFAFLCVSPAIANPDFNDYNQEAPNVSIGEPGQLEQVTRTVQVIMYDSMRFVPAKIRVKQGETIRFIVRNAGQLRHEMSLGTPEQLKEQAELMTRFPDMEHADENQVAVDPGEEGKIIWKFTEAGPVYFACLQPGHYEAGMKGTLQVRKAPR